MFEFLVAHFLGNIPTWVFPFMAGGGFAVYFLAGIVTRVPPLRMYGLIAKPVAFIIFVVGVFLYGGAGVIAIQQHAIEEANHKVELADQAIRDATDKLSQALAANEHLVKGRGYGVKQIIEKDRAKIDADCKRINDDAWEDYNRAVKNTGSKILSPKDKK
jgi:hypothetical protein